MLYLSMGVDQHSLRHFTILSAKLRSSTILNTAVERLSRRVGDLLDRSHAIGFLRLLAGAVGDKLAVRHPPGGRSPSFARSKRQQQRGKVQWAESEFDRSCMGE